MKSALKNIICVLLFVTTLLPLEAQPAATSSSRPKVGVVFGGGGAKGAAHIGVLKYMEELGIPVDYVAGTSIGSIIGGLYSLGYTPDEMADLIAHMDWPFYMSNTVGREYQSSVNRQNGSTYLLSVPFGANNFEERSSGILSTLPSGVINGYSLLNLFNSLSIGYQDSISFDDLPIPFACVAIDILNGDSVVLRSGEFAKAIRSSMAIPGVFSPVTWDNHLLADGGMVDNFPVDVCKNMGADIVVGIELADEFVTNPAELQSLPQQMSQYMSIAVKGNRFQHRDMCDIYMHPDITGYNMLSFDAESIDSLVVRGYRVAQEHRDEFLALKARLDSYGPCSKQLNHPRAKHILPTDTFVLASINYKGVSEDKKDWLVRKSGLEPGAPITMEHINRAIGILNGTGAFSGVLYKLHETDEEYWLSHHVYTDVLGRESYDLDITLLPAEPHTFSIGLRYDSEESADLLFQFGWNERRLTGFKADLDIDLSYNFKLATRLAFCGLGVGDINLAYRYHTSTFNVFRYDSVSLTGLVVDHNNFSLYLSEFHLRDMSIAFGVEEDLYTNRYGFSLNNLIESGIFHFDRAKAYLGFFLRSVYDNLDNAYFATRGVYATVDAGWRKENALWFKNNGGGMLNAGATWQTYLSTGQRFAFIPQISARVLVGDDSSLYLRNIVGGSLPGRYLDHQLAFVGVNNPLQVGNLTAIARLDLRYNFYGKFYLYLMSNYIASADLLNHFFTGKDDYHGTLGVGLRVAYASPIGPVSLDLHWNDFNYKVGAYVNIGYVF